MHKSIRRALKKFRNEYEELLESAVIAELGSLNINGSPREYLPPLTGFDIAPGNDVDVVIEYGVIPPEHQGKYDVVITSSSFHYCPDPNIYKREILHLMKPKGLLWLSMCGPKCKCNHTTSNNKYGFTDSYRMTKEELEEFLSLDFNCIACVYGGDKHHQDIFYLGERI